MTGYMFVMGPCFACKRVFSFNADFVPSFPDPNTGVKEPVCGNCMRLVNEKRAANGLEPFSILPGAYEPQEVA